jgi:casein kinase II regulatory subunit
LPPPTDAIESGGSLLSTSPSTVAVLEEVYFDEMSTSSGTPESWISSFCSLLGHEYFAEVSEEFIEDDFNLTGLQAQVAMYKEALEVWGYCLLSVVTLLLLC